MGTMHAPHLVSISGPPISGKTALLSDLALRLGSRAEYVPDLPRIAFGYIGTSLPEKNLEAFQHYIGFAQLIAESRELQGTTVRFLDKSLIDAVAYWDVLIGESRPVWAQALHRKRYSVVILCEQIDAIAEPTGPQSLHVHLRDRLEAQIRQVAHEATEHLCISSGSRAIRAQKVIEILYDLQIIQ